ncbi:hypothetical protein RRF57_001111 [Xylaria bambusicola]|uniref:Dicer-like protein 1 n=1 Tax=Xylaria bambusicola TaxID=326684 RepID=A0AAN7U4H0_9PEZI
MEDYARSEDEDSVQSDVPPQPAASEHLVQDKFLFDDWLRGQREHTYKNRRARGLVASREDLRTNSNPDFLEDGPIISSPREYQTELFERAKRKNIIAVLDTGTGKTLIAALLLRHVVEQELEDRRAGHDHRLALFLVRVSVRPRCEYPNIVDKVALVHQQFRVLEANLDFQMESFTGDSGGPIYTRQFWSEMTDNKTVIVCTAEILHQCLCHSFIRMEQINLLIFDEAHHAKKNHPYARIIKDFYATLEKSNSKRPRILGMTASPVDAKTNVHVAAAQLEGLLHCEIATVSDPVVFSRASISKPTEGLLEYQNVGISFETVLWQKLDRLVGQNGAFARILTYSKNCTTELGRWAADRVWKLWLTEEEEIRIEAKTERSFNRQEFLQSSNFLCNEREAMGAIRQANQLIKNHLFPELELNQFCLSHKVMKLVEHLKENFNPKTDKCIVFAEQRLTVALLTDLFQQPALSCRGYKAGKLMGSAGSTSGDLGMTLTEQKSIIKRFRNSDLNCLFTTSAGEEGIDIPDCNFVIRFDLYKTVIQYIQSRGRARSANSKFYQMIETGNLVHRQLIAEIQDHEVTLRDFCNMLPEDRLISGCDYNIDYHLSKERKQRIYKVPSTGATLTYKFSIALLAKFVSSLQQSVKVFCDTADYIVHNVGGEFQCEVLLPDVSPIKSAIGRRASSKQVAKCSAAFEMCLKLRRQKHLDDNLQSVFSKCLPAMRNARLAISSKKRVEYPVKRKPDLWAVLGFPEKLFVMVIKLSSPHAIGRPSRPLALLTREPLMGIAEFPLYFANQQVSEVECFPLPGAMGCDPRDIDGLNKFTLRIFKDVFSKEYAPEAEKMPYFFAPLVHSHCSKDLTQSGDPHGIIDWECIRTIQNGLDHIEWEGQKDNIFDNRFVTDPFDGSRKFYTIRRRPDLRPTDPQLPGLPRNKRHGDLETDIWSSIAQGIWRKSRRKLTPEDDLSVIEAEYIPLRRNLLDKFDTIGETDRRCYLVFQTLHISALPVEIVVMAYNLPSVIYRLESNLIVLESCRSMSLDLQPDLALEAMTKDSDNTEERREDQVNIQRGMGRNYERLEFLGDSFLKMSTTIALFSQAQDCDEFQYHVDRMVLICNKNLFNNALELKLEQSIRTRAFDRSTWYPEGLNLLKGRKYSNLLKGTHVLADKSIADVCEALIGAAYMATREQRNFDMAIQAVTRFVNHQNHRMTTYGDYYAAYQIPEWQSSEPRARRRWVLSHTLPTALSMREYPTTSAWNFLGTHFSDMFPGADPQWMTEHKMAMVSNQFQGCLCVSLNLQKHMVSMDTALHKEIADYVTNITEARTQAEDEAEASSLGRAAYARNYWTIEYDYGEVQRFFNTHILPYFEDIRLYDTYANNHPVTLLSQVLNTEFCCKRWRVMVSETDDEDREFAATKVVAGIMIHGIVRENAYASSGSNAKSKAAQKMLNKLKETTLDEFRKGFNCTCS